MSFLEEELERFELALAKGDLFNHTVSSVGTFWQIDHSLKVILSVIKALEQSDPKTYHWKFNWLRHVILTVGAFPRGKARAPKAVLPPDHLIKAEIEAQIQLIREQLPLLTKLPAKAYFKHPYFGDLNLKSTLRFLKIHSRHHLKIIRDITKNPS